jgi:hypothetical protein
MLRKHLCPAQGTDVALTLPHQHLTGVGRMLFNKKPSPRGADKVDAAKATVDRLA